MPRAPPHQRVGLGLELGDRLDVERPQARHRGKEVVGEEAHFDRPPRPELDLLGESAERLGAELPRFRFHRVRRKHQAGRVAGVHRRLDPADRFLAILTEIAENARESRAQLAARRTEDRPVDDFLLVPGPLVHDARLGARG